MRHRHGTCRGAALPIALATLAVSLTAVVTLAAMASSTKLVRAADRSTIIADDLLAAAEVSILHWLGHESAKVVLPDDAVSPMVHVMHDMWSVEGVEHELRITAWDQCGMVPAGALKSGSPLRLAVPDHVLSMLDSAMLDLAGLGLDSLSGEAQGQQVFPQAPAGDHAGEHAEPVVFGDSAITSRLKNDRSESAVGAFLATHQGSAGRQARGNVPQAVINVNTAPMPLVTAALREAGRGGIEQIAAARAAGELISIASLPSLAGSVSERSTSGGSGGLINLVGVSNAWSFRIDIRVGNVIRSWWAVYVSSPASEQGWEVVQRLVIEH